ncbi:hypothetical protein SASPL_117959 [Salvia splendens]|uniref:TIGR00297 family protein n=1 Tax=Salvia splendens TaxID=180675 RepID=A0A8X8ZY16_SALSN|nr:hypothetical protein SASPL_117959 [Salvia splendens]
MATLLFPFLSFFKVHLFSLNSRSSIKNPSFPPLNLNPQRHNHARGILRFSSASSRYSIDPFVSPHVAILISQQPLHLPSGLPASRLRPLALRHCRRLLPRHSHMARFRLFRFPPRRHLLPPWHSSNKIEGTAATKLKLAQKEAHGVAEKRRGRRGPSSVIGSSAAGCVCALLSIYGFGGGAFPRLWELGFVASFCTKLSDTVSSEIGKAYAKTTYLVTTFKTVPRGTEGAISIEGTVAGLCASIFLASVGFMMAEPRFQFTRLSFLAQLNNDVANIINISLGSSLAVLMQQQVLRNRTS